MEQAKRLAPHHGVLGGLGGCESLFRHQHEKGIQRRLRRLGLGERTPGQFNWRNILGGNAPAQLRGAHGIEVAGHYEAPE